MRTTARIVLPVGLIFAPAERLKALLARSWPVILIVSAWRC